MNFEDILYEVRNGVAWITINRPEKMNAFRGTTCDELIRAINRAGYDKSIGAIVLAGAGDRAFCTGGDQSAHDGNYDGRGTIGLPMEELHDAIRNVPKPVIARVQGYAIGGGNVLATICDLTICSDKAIFGQVGPKMGSVDPGYGTAFLARVVGEKKAREMWYLNMRYSGAEAVAMGLANVEVLAERAEDVGRGILRESMQLVMARAVAPLAELLEYTAPLAAPGGTLALAKGSSYAEEVRSAAYASELLGCGAAQAAAMREVISETVSVVLYRKERATPAELPRRAGVPHHRPLSAK